MNILISYAYMMGGRDNPLLAFARANKRPIKLMLDSGAYTAYHQGKTIKLKDYCVFCARYGHLFEGGYVQLDKIGDFSTTLVRLKAMRSVGLSPIPVLTIDADVERVAELLPSPRICLAGVAARTSAWMRDRVRKVRAIVGPDVSIHILGTSHTDRRVWEEADSMDSSTYVVASRYGAVAHFTGFSFAQNGTPKALLSMRKDIGPSRKAGFNLFVQWSQAEACRFHAHAKSKGVELYHAVSGIDGLRRIVAAGASTLHGTHRMNWGVFDWSIDAMENKKASPHAILQDAAASWRRFGL